MRNIVLQISRELNKNTYQFLIVSSGSITSGSEHLHITPSSISEKQAAAAVGQILLMKEYFQFFSQEGFHIAQILLTKDGLCDKKRYSNAKNTIAIKGLIECGCYSG